MRYYIDLYSPATAAIFDKSSRDVSGFSPSRKTYINNQQIGLGDKLICYVTRVQRFIGVLEIMGKPFEDKTPIFAKDDPFTLRFRVKPIVWLPIEKAIPIHESIIWNHLSFTKNLRKNGRQWEHMVYQSPFLWPAGDCKYLERILLRQASKPVDYPLAEDDLKKMKSTKIRVSDKKEVIVSVPDEEDELVGQMPASESEQRESTKVQAKLAEIGEILGYKIWLPNSDRARVTAIWHPQDDALLNELPLVFDYITLSTIKNIDVLWIKRRSIIRAFEVEDTTSIISGILRMADLIALQPMLDIKIHIVAPNERKDSVLRHITRPAFTDIGGKQLSDVCSYIDYESVYALEKEKNLKHMYDTVIDSYADRMGD
jgi:hypothetical protein